ncbi:MAG: hypothetical protein IJH08_02790, partial [Atopobiaceae bacterium]|nr:hypothetical protein [Atopobiaceae bacterium]
IVGTSASRITPETIARDAKAALDSLRATTPEPHGDGLGGEGDDSDIFSADMDAEMAKMALEAGQTLIGGETAQFRAITIEEEEGEDAGLEAEVDQIMEELLG